MATLESSLSPITALEAVNDMLLSIGQGKINSLASSESGDAENAKTALITHSREVQARGWYFNTDYEYTLLPDTTGSILLPEGCLEFSPTPTWRHLTERNRQLYDRRAHTFKHAAGISVTGSIKWLLEFDTLPQAARTYIHRRAGRAFQVGAIGSDLLYKFTREMEFEALAELTRAHLRTEQPNAIYDNAQTFRTAAGGRTPRIY